MGGDSCNQGTYMCVLKPNYSRNSTEEATRVEKNFMFQETGDSCHERLETKGRSYPIVTLQQCAKKKMKLHTEIDPQNILTENQTWLFWSGHHRSQTRQNSST